MGGLRVLITGGTGFIGRALVGHLLREGHKVTVLSRQRPNQVTNLLSDNVEPVRSLSAVTGCYDAVVNLAGAGIMDKRWTDHRKDVLTHSRVGLTNELVQFMGNMETPPSVMISGSAIGFYGTGEENEVFDECSLRGSDFAATLCGCWEEAALRAESMGTRVCLVRTGVVLHPRGGALQQMLPAFRMGVGGALGSGKQIMSWIHLDDMIEILMVLLQKDSFQGPYNASAPVPVSNEVFSRTLGGVLGRPAVVKVPEVALRVMLGESSVMVLKGQKVLPKRLQEAGFKFEYPNIEQALHALLKT